MVTAGGSPLVQGEGRGEWEYERHPVDGKTAFVRLYANPEEAASFTLLPIPIDHAGVRVDPSELPENAMLVLVSRDQADPLVAEALGDCICAWYRDTFGRNDSGTVRFDLRRTPRSGAPSAAESEPNERLLTVLDALGEPISEGLVTLRLQGRGQNGSDVRADVELGVVDESGSCALPNLTMTVTQCLFRIAADGYGRGEVEATNPQPGEVLQFPLLPENSPLMQERGVRGQVQTLDGVPVEGARITCGEIRTLGEGLISPREVVGALTDRDGRFYYYPVVPSTADQLAKTGRLPERGEAIPPGSRYSLYVHPPDDTLWAGGATAMGGREVLVQLESGGSFHTFRIETEEGVLDDPSERASLALIVESSSSDDGGKKRYGLPRYALSRGCVVPNGTLTGELHLHDPAIDQLVSYTFGPVTVNEESPRELVLRPRTPPMYRGRVVHGVTGEALSGAFVVAMWSSGQGSLSDITAEEWDALHGLPERPALGASALKPVTRCFGFTGVARTDSDGAYEVGCLPGTECYGVAAFEQDYVGFKWRVVQLPVDPEGTELPPIRLFPSARVRIEIGADVRNVSIAPKWVIDRDGNPPWAEAFFPDNWRRNDGRFQYDGWLEPNEPVTFHVPADIIVRVTLRTPYADEWAPLELPDAFHLAQGETVDLGRVELTPSTAVTVTVVDGEGKPLEGVPVRFGSGQCYGLPHTSNQNGVAFFQIPPNAQGRFAVTYDDVRVTPPGSSSHNVVEAPVDMVADPMDDWELVLPDSVAKVLR
jgi:hypothetical protein